MAQVDIPDSLLAEIGRLGDDVRADAFVIAAVREKLSSDQCKREFCLRSDQTRHAMQQAGLSEEEVLADFEAFREKLSGEKRG